MFSPTTPSFFKIILPETLQHKKLRIPKKFVRLYGNALSDQVVLKLPCGSEWRVGLKKNGSNNEMCLETGLPEFFEFYSLKYGSLIVFRYIGSSKFETLIFDTSAVEIDYPEKSGNSKRKKRTEEVENSDDEITIFDDASAWQKANDLSSEKRSKTSPNNNIDRASESKVTKRTLKNPVRKRSSKIPNLKTKGEELDGKSKDPNFVIIIRPSYTESRYPRIPVKFCEAYINENRGELSFSVLDGRTWSAQYKVRNNGKSVRVTEVHRGWTEFARGNNLKVGDVCRFELTERNGRMLSFQVSIARNGRPSPDKDMNHTLES